MVENISIYHIHSDTYTYQLLPSDEITTDPQEKAITFTNRLYREILNREADAEGLAFWLAKLNDGTVSPDQLLGEFENSAEFKVGIPDKRDTRSAPAGRSFRLNRDAPM